MSELESALQRAEQGQRAGGLNTRQYLDQWQPAVGRRLGIQNKAQLERYMALVYNEIQRTPDLADCFSTAKGRDSILNSIFQMAQLQLEPGPLGLCYLLPFRNTRESFMACTFILGYKGMIQLAYRDPSIQEIEAHVVYEGDEFDWAYGLEKRLYHRPKGVVEYRMREVVAAYAVARTVRGGKPYMVLDRKELDYYKSMAKGTNRPDSPWQRNPAAMYRKTPIRRLFSDLPLLTSSAAEIAEVFAEDEKRETLDWEEASNPPIESVSEELAQDEAKSEQELALER